MKKSNKEDLRLKELCALRMFRLTANSDKTISRSVLQENDADYVPYKTLCNKLIEKGWVKHTDDDQYIILN